MTLNGVMAVTLRYFTEFGKHAFQHNRFRTQERKFTFAISSAGELLVYSAQRLDLFALCKPALNRFLDALKIRSFISFSFIELTLFSRLRNYVLCVGCMEVLPIIN